jgi:hypothetical protein
MNRITFGIVAGLIFGAVDVALMIPMTFADKTIAMAGAFASRFAIGFLTSVTSLPLPGWARGALVGLLVSIPDAVITGGWVPILATGIAGGAIIGALVDRFAK